MGSPRSQGGQEGSTASLPRPEECHPSPLCSSALPAPEQMITEMEHMGPKVTGPSGKVTLLPQAQGEGAPLDPEHSFSLCSSQGRKVTHPENEMCTL